ncbi:MAG TPA: hypothetical protein VLT61_13380, partial [Anaeromyxobacteraceae bacterium]|nr:hypothetical protein [Anaeromyxobacteraceae bacterium]
WQMMKPLVTSDLFIKGLKTAFVALGVAIGVVVAAIAAAGVIFGAVQAAVVGFGVALWGVIGYVIEFVGGILTKLGELESGAISAAGNFVSGLVQGIVAGAGAVAEAVANLARTALSTFTGIFGIHSPSTVMLEHGEENIAGAAATGIEEGAPKVDRAMQKLGPKTGGARGGSSANGGRSFSFQFSNCTFGAGMSQATVDEMFRAAAEKFFGEEGASGPEPATT